MENPVELIRAAQVYLQASNLIVSTLPLRQQILNCYHELTLILKLDAPTQADLARISDLKDEIWGCRIELQAMRVKANNLLKTAQYIRFGDVEPPTQFAACS